MPSSNVVAPLTGLVLEIHAAPGQTVNAGALLFVLESMKVHVRVEAEHSGVVESISVELGDNVQRDTPMLSIKRDQATTSHRPTGSLESSPHTSIGAFKNRQALAMDSARDQARQKRHSKGYLTARENLANLCDPNTFQEYGQFAVAAQRQREDYETLKTSTAADGIITGIGQVNGTAAVLAINDYSVLAGTQGFFHHQKLDRILDTARDQRLPVIMYTEGGGGRPGDTDVTVVNSGLQCKSFGTWAGLSGVVPRIAVANGYNFAGNAALFGAADITIATQSSWIGMAGPAMIEGGGLGSFKATEIGPIDVQSGNSTVDIVAEDEIDAAQIATRVLAYFQGHTKQWTAHDQSSLQSAMPENRRQTYDIRRVIETLTDVDSFTELKAAYGPAIVSGFARIEGHPIGLLANDCMTLGGAIDVAAGEKAAQFMQLCNQFSIPLVSLCDTPGFMVGPEHETQGAVRRLAELFRVGAQITTPLYAVVVRKCYGLGAQAMLGGSTQRPLYTLAWPTGEFGPMGLEGAVKLGFRKELEAEPDENKRQILFDQLLSSQYQRGLATEIASVLEVDAVIDPVDTRTVIAARLASS